MAITKFEKQYNDMMTRNKKVFDDLKSLSNKPKSEDFRQTQLKALRVIKINEDALCSKTEKNKSFSSFSMQLSDKFWERIRAEYPEIDYSTLD